MSMPESLPSQTQETDCIPNLRLADRVSPIGHSTEGGEVWINGRKREVAFHPADLDARLAAAETAGRTIIANEVEFIA
jgi:hypothetical protein